MAEGKWIHGLTADMPAVEAARTILDARLGVVRHYLPLAIEEPWKDLEYIHQLRVSTRRTAAALRIFEPLFKDKPAKRLKNSLRDIRQAAGHARDWDVTQVHMLASPALSKASEAQTLLLAYALGHRSAAQAALTNLDESDFDHLESTSDLLAEGDENLTILAEIAQETLNEQLIAVGTILDDGPESPEELHATRIAGKRLRYSMELFADCYSDPFRAVLYPLVEELQEHLGDVQDAHVMLTRLDQLQAEFTAKTPATLKTIRPTLTKYRSELRRQQTTATKKFRTWSERWNETTTAHPLNELLLAK
ncbi:MAG: CHAD domain-containing protein [Fimbriiglobus sp.]